MSAAGASGWPFASFAELVESGTLEIGDGYRAKNEELGGDGPIFLRAGLVQDGGIDLTGAERFLAERASAVAGKTSRFGDVLMTTKGNSTGRSAFVTEQLPSVVYSPHLSYWRSLRPDILVPGYLRYWSRSAQFHEQLSAMAESTDMAPYLSLTDQRRLRIAVPPVSIQLGVAEILGALDDKVELNRRMSETLEATARALFKSWFVDCAEGSVPAGWDVRTVGTEFNLVMGQSPPGSTYNEVGDGKPFYQGRADFGFRFPGRRVYCTAATRFARAGDTLVSVRAPVGAINMAIEDCAIGRGVAAARHRTGSRIYTYEFMRSKRDIFDHFDGEGTVFGAIGRKDFEAMPCLAPPDAIVRQYDEQMSDVDRRIEVCQREMLILAETRDALLPKLISGELRTKDADQLVDAVSA